MKTRLSVSVLLATTLFLAVSTTVARSAKPSSTGTEDVQVIDVTAKKYEFNPSPIWVRRGAKIQLRITATDRPHGFKISEFPDGADSNGSPGLVFTSPQQCQRIEKDQAATVEFVAQNARDISLSVLRSLWVAPRVDGGRVGRRTVS
jgi:hypothetical protein